MQFDGAVFNPAFDESRLTKQIGRVYSLMSDGSWRTLNEIANITKDPESSISAQLRNLRKERFGSYVVSRRPRGDRSTGLFEYRLSKAEPRFEFDSTGQGVFCNG